MTTFITARRRSNVNVSAGLVGTYFVVGDFNQIRKSTDSGATWSIVTGPSGAGNLLCVSGFDENNIWVSDDNNKIYYSNDGGDSWGTPYTGPTNYHARHMYFVSTSEGYASYVNAAGFYYSEVYKWNGTTWNKVDTARSNYRYICGIFSDGNGNIIQGSWSSSGNTKTVRYSTNYGASWADSTSDLNKTGKGVYIYGGTYYILNTDGLYSSPSINGTYSLIRAVETNYTIGPFGVPNVGLFTPDGVNFYWYEYHNSTGDDYIAHWDGVSYDRYLLSNGLNNLFGVSIDAVFGPLGSNTIAIFDGSTISEVDIQEGGTFATYRYAWGCYA